LTGAISDPDQETISMINRWNALALLFTVRLAMAFQFQAVAALAPSIMHTYGIGVGDIGLLIGLYLSPGILLAIPGGTIGRRFGDKQAVLAGLVLMTAGGLLMVLLDGWWPQVAGRILAGIGGVILNVLMSKMITDRFAGREIATAMGIFVNSWPVGIALALVILPWIDAFFGLSAAMLAVAGFAFIGALLLAVFYQNPASANAGGSPEPLTGRASTPQSLPASSGASTTLPLAWCSASARPCSPSVAGTTSQQVP
jgi:MFS family permease